MTDRPIPTVDHFVVIHRDGRPQTCIAYDHAGNALASVPVIGAGRKASNVETPQGYITLHWNRLRFEKVVHAV